MDGQVENIITPVAHRAGGRGIKPHCSGKITVSFSSTISQYIITITLEISSANI